MSALIHKATHGLIHKATEECLTDCFSSSFKKGVTLGVDSSLQSLGVQRTAGDRSAIVW